MTYKLKGNVQDTLNSLEGVHILFSFQRGKLLNYEIIEIIIWLIFIAGILRLIKTRLF